MSLRLNIMYCSVSEELQQDDKTYEIVSNCVEQKYFYNLKAT